MRAPSTVPRYLWDDENRPAVNRLTFQGLALTTLIWAGSSFMAWRTSHPIWLAAPAILVLLRADQMVSMWVFRSRWWVYYLRDSTSELIYIGSTNDLQRRLSEHTDDRSEPWKRTIRYHTISRICRSEKQARRIEERRIRAITVAAKHAWCPPLRNKTWSTTAPKGLGILAARLWSWVYIVESATYNEARWHTKPCKVWTVPLRPAAAEHADEDWTEPDDQTDEPTADTHTYEATYMRPNRHTLTPIELGPVRPRTSASADASDSTPPKGENSVHATDTMSEAERLLAERRAKDAQRKRDKRQASKAGGAA